MKDFMLIFIGEDYSELGLSPEGMQERMSNWWVWQSKMDKQGICKGGNALHPTGMRLSGSDKVATDMASAELKELVGGYYIVTAENMEGACKIAEDYPDYDIGGTCEVREVMVFDR